MTRQDDTHAFRAQELLLKRATEGLEPHEAAELAALGADHDISFDLAAASIDIATLRDIDEMPAGVADKILVAAGVAQPTSSMSMPSTLAGVMPTRPGQSLTQIPSTLAGVAPARPLGVPVPPPQPADELAAARVKKPSRVVEAYVAAAVAIAVAAGAIVWARFQEPMIITKEVERVVMPATPTPSEARAQLLANAKDVTTLAWTATDDTAAKGASGDVVWSASQQKGFMRFVGLAVNDPKALQYQLWIFDKNRDQAFPVDGGVFDITPSGEVIVQISAKLPVGEPVLFAVTVEQPGGVVVSKRERIVVTAAPPKTG
ncbi:MAG: anti-sigma factor [Myxococcota bacterium]|nr:anti-sigma factor [Deltaproteobacteria bacterium]MDQ3337869.1 anti-sigma factor [Myxococcota bacterium]